jgi:hypothetical protein
MIQRGQAVASGSALASWPVSTGSGGGFFLMWQGFVWPVTNFATGLCGCRIKTRAESVPFILLYVRVGFYVFKYSFGAQGAILTTLVTRS